MERSDCHAASKLKLLLTKDLEEAEEDNMEERGYIYVCVRARAKSRGGCIAYLQHPLSNLG